MFTTKYLYDIIQYEILEIEGDISMNQILDYNPNKSSSGGSSGSDKVVRVFAICLAVFAVCLLAIGGVTLLKNKKEEPATPVAQATKAQISVEQLETTLKIKVVHDKAIEKIIYKWDNEKENTINCNGQTEIEKEISLLSGSHALTIKVIDVNGEESLPFEQSFESSIGEDKEKPTIETELNVNKLIVKVEDDTALDFVTYRWNNDEEIVVQAEEGQKSLEFEIEILKGKNDLMIVAVDKSNNSESKSASYTGVTKPEVYLEVSAEKDSVYVKITHDTGIKEVMLELNGQSQNVGIGDDSPTEVVFSFGLPNSTNIIKIVAVSVDDTKTEKELEVVNDSLTADNIEITLTQSEEDRHLAVINIKSPDGISSLKLNINDMDLEVPLGDEIPPEERREISFTYPLVDGNNKFVFHIVRPDGLEKHETKEIYCEEEVRR